MVELGLTGNGFWMLQTSEALLFHGIDLWRVCTHQPSKGAYGDVHTCCSTLANRQQSLPYLPLNKTCARLCCAAERMTGHVCQDGIHVLPVRK